MAKFKASNIELLDDQHISFDTAKAKTLSYDGSELGFSAVVSGVTPTEDYHLSTKAYADSVGGVGDAQSGLYSISDATKSFNITFAPSYDDTAYALVGDVVNTTDSNPAKYGYTISAMSTGGVTIELSGYTNSANYEFQWRAGFGGGQGEQGIQGTDGSPSVLDPDCDGDHTVSGNTAPMTVGENVVFGDALYMKSDGKLWKTDANAAATVPCMAMAAATINADASGTVLLSGFARDDTWGWTIGSDIMVSATAGEFSHTVLAGVGDQVQRVGMATHADRMYFNPDSTVVEVAA